MRKSLFTLVLPAMLFSAPAVAQSSTGQAAASQQAQATPRTSSSDDIVCERVPVVGSRLVKKKVCMTRAQWADQRREDRTATESAQIHPSKNN